jgi:hypothetical protein
VDISYGISAEADFRNSNGIMLAYIVTRLIIDGTERREFRSICGRTRYLHVFKFQRVFLTAGTHRVVLQWKSSEKFDSTGNSISDWKSTYLKFIY